MRKSIYNIKQEKTNSFISTLKKNERKCRIQSFINQIFYLFFTFHLKKIMNENQK